MNEQSTLLLSHIRPFIDADDLRPSLLLTIGQVALALLVALLVSNGLAG